MPSLIDCKLQRMRNGRYRVLVTEANARKLPNRNPKVPKRVSFTVDKHGRPIAYLVSMSQMRNFRISYDRAKMMVATGEAIEVPYRPFGSPTSYR